MKMVLEFRNREQKQSLLQSVQTYGEMVDSGKRVIVAVTEKPEMFTSTYSYRSLKCQFDWVWSSETNVVSPWADTTDVAYLKDFLEVRCTAWYLYL